MTHRITTLSNGLTVATDEVAEIASAAISIWIHAGARNETPTENGIAHFLEHMLFKGTPTRSAKQIAEDFDAIGGHLNAYTSREHTVYYARVLKDDVGIALSLLGDMLQHSVMDPIELERERGVILQEIGQTEDSPDDILFDYHQAVAFPNQPLGRPVLGTRESISSIQAEDLFNFTHHHYHPANMVMAVAGGIRHDDILRSIEKIFKGLSAPTRDGVIKGAYHGGDFRKKDELEQLHMVIGLKGISYLDPEIYALQVLSTVLGGGMSSRLFQEVREKRGLAYTIQASMASYHDIGMLHVYAGTGEAQASELMTVVCQELLKVTDSVNEQELHRAKAQLKASILMDTESMTARSEELGKHLTCYGRVISTAEMIQNIENVSAIQVASLMRRLLTQTAQPTLSLLGPINQAPDYAYLQQQLKL